MQTISSTTIPVLVDLHEWCQLDMQTITSTSLSYKVASHNVISTGLQTTTDILFSPQCRLVGTSAHARYLMRNTAMDDSIGGS